MSKCTNLWRNYGCGATFPPFYEELFLFALRVSCATRAHSANIGAVPHESAGSDALASSAGAPFMETRVYWMAQFLPHGRWHSDARTGVHWGERLVSSRQCVNSGADRRGDTHNGLCLRRSLAFLDSSDFRGSALCPTQRNRLTKNNNSCQQHNFTTFQIYFFCISPIIITRHQCKLHHN